MEHFNVLNGVKDMQDTTRFDLLYEDIELNVEIPEEREDMYGHMEVLQERLIRLRGFVFRCLTNGWTDDDLFTIREWIQEQGDLTRLDQVAVNAIDALTAAPPATEPRPPDPMPLGAWATANAAPTTIQPTRIIVENWLAEEETR